MVLKKRVQLRRLDDHVCTDAGDRNVNDHLVQVETMLIDKFLPDYDFVETHSIYIRAGAADIYLAANEVDFTDSFIIRWLFRLRGLSTESVTMESLTRSRFEVLGEAVNREVVLGIIGKFWTLHGDLKKLNAKAFTEFDTAGYAKAVWNFSLEPNANGTRLSTETRIKCIDVDSRRRFGFYWKFIQPFSGLIRMEMLRAIRNRAEMTAPSAAASG
jgi:hypothetical protein